MANWKTGTGYPSANASLDEWEYEFLRRGPNGLKGHPHFKLPDGRVEFFAGAAIVQINDDGSLLDAPNPTRSSATHMVVQFELSKPIGPQIEQAKRWLRANQKHRFVEPTNRQQTAIYRRYLRTLDAVASGVSQSKITEVLHPITSDPKRVSGDLKVARKLARDGLRMALIPK